MSKKYTVQNAAGRKVTFNWDHSEPPTDADMEQVFAQAEAVKPSSAATPESAPASADTGSQPADSMVLPALNEYVKSHGDGFSLGREGAIVKDVASLPRRAFGAGVELIRGNPAGAKEEMLRTQGKGILENIQREAPLALMPIAGAAGEGASAIGRVASTLLNGARAAVPSAAAHQLENASNDQGISAGGFAKEVATGGLLNGAFDGVQNGVAAGLKWAVPKVKQGISKLSEVSKEALGAVSNPVGGASALERFKAAAKKYGNPDGGTDLTPLSEEIAGRVGAENASRIAATDASRVAQQNQMEASLLRAHNDVTGGQVKRIQDISAGDRGEGIKFSIEQAKPAMQKTYKEGDLNAYSGLRQAPALTKKITRTVMDNEPNLVPDGQGGMVEEPGLPRTVTEDVPVLPGKINEVLTKFKALTPEDGVADITPGAEKGIKWLSALASRAKTVDDLVSLKGQARGLQASGGFEGALFDASRDDLALAQVQEAIHGVEVASIKKAAPKRANQILPLVEANNELYGKTLDVLRKGDQKFRQIQNSENIISKIKGMGPEEARNLMTEMQTNKVLQPYVKELQKGFFDDLLLSGMKDGQFQPKELAKEWSNISDDIKQAWLTPKIISSIDESVANGTKEIADPALIGENLFGKKLDTFLGEKRLGNITTEAQKKAMAELESLDSFFGSDYTQEAVSAYRAKQLQLGDTGKLPSMGSIRTGKSVAAASAGAAVGGSMGAAVAGPLGTAVGSAAGTIGGFYLQSPAGAVMMFKALNRLEQSGALRGTLADVSKKTITQGLRMQAGTAQRINP